LLEVTVAAVAPLGVREQQLSKAADLLPIAQTWLVEYAEWIGIIRERLRLCSGINQAVAKDHVRLEAIQDGIVSLERAKEWLHPEDYEKWEPILEHRKGVCSQFERIIGSKHPMNIGLSDLEFVENASKEISWLDQGHFLSLQVSHDVQAAQTVRAVVNAHADGHTVSSAQVSEAMLFLKSLPEGTGSTEEEEDRRKEKMSITAKHLAIQRLKRATGDNDVCCNECLDSPALIEEARNWLNADEVSLFNELLTPRLAVLRNIRDAAIGQNIAVVTLEKARAQLCNFMVWASPSGDTWHRNVLQRFHEMDTIRRAANDFSVSINQISKAHVLLPSVVSWLVEARVWKIAVSQRFTSVNRIDVALKDHGVTPRDVKAAIHSIDEAEAWLAQSSLWRAKLMHRANIISLIDAAATPDDQVGAGNATLLCSATIFDADALIHGNQWLVLNPGVSDIVQQRRELVEKLTTKVLEPGIKTSEADLQQLMQTCKESSVWFIEAASIETTIQGRLRALNLLEHASSENNVSIDEVANALVEVKEARCWLNEEDTAEFESVIVVRANDLAKARLATGSETTSDAVSAAQEAITRIGAWIASSDAQEFDCFESRLKVISKLQTAIGQQASSRVVLDVYTWLRTSEVDVSWLKGSKDWLSIVESRHSDYLEHVQQAVASSGVHPQTIKNAVKKLRRGELNWVPDSEAAEWEDLLNRRLKSLTVIESVVGDLSEIVKLDVQSLIEAEKAINDSNWIEGKVFQQFKERIESRLLMLQVVNRSAFSKTCVSELEKAQNILASDGYWMRDSGTWKTELDRRSKIAQHFKLLAVGTKTSGYPLIPASDLQKGERQLKQTSEEWLEEIPLWRAKIKHRMDLVRLIRDQALASRNVDVATVRAAIQHIDETTSWLLESEPNNIQLEQASTSKGWKTLIEERQAAIHTIEQGLMTDIDIETLEAAYDAVNSGGNRWLKEAANWAIELEVRHKDVQLIKLAATRTKAINVEVLEHAAHALKVALPWLKAQAERNLIQTRVDAITEYRAAKSSQSGTTTFAEINKVAQSTFGMSQWLVEAKKWREEIQYRLSMAQNLHQVVNAGNMIKNKSSINHENHKDFTNTSTVEGEPGAQRHPQVTEAMVDQAFQDLDTAEDWLAETQIWRLKIEARHKELVDVRRVANETGICAEEVKLVAQRMGFETDLQSKENLDPGGIQTLLTHWLAINATSALGQSIRERLAVVKGAEAALAKKDVSAAQVDGALGPLQAARVWLLEAPRWCKEVERRIEIIRLVKVALTGSVEASMIERAAQALEEADEWYVFAEGEEMSP